MITKPIDDIKDTILREHFNFLQENGQGLVLELEAAPTDTDPLLEDNESGLYSDVLYVRKSSTIYVFTPGSTITIT